jgi:hypothetical protein
MEFCLMEFRCRLDKCNHPTAWSRRVTVSLDGHKLPLICRADLIQNKRTVGRPQDIADVLEPEKLDSL